MERLRFDAADQSCFAALSGDRNPLHVDAVAARRLLTGRPVVHGVHTLLKLLEGWPPADLPGTSDDWRIEAEFLNPLSVGDVAGVAYDRDDTGTPRAVATVAGLAGCRAYLRTCGVPATPASSPAGADEEAITVGELALDREPQDWAGRRQMVALPEARFDAQFPVACSHLGERRVAAIALLSTYVGMVCPGLHSVFSSLVVEPGAPGHDGRVHFHVQRYDPRFRLMLVAFDGVVRGQLKAFVRTPAQPQAGVDDLRTHVAPGEFAGTVHWVLGGSRGLGELAAKLLAAGGARVCLSYAAGRDDAARVVQEIAEAGAPAAIARQMDLLHGGCDDWLHELPWPDAVWYFATPRIYRKRAAAFDAAVLDEFLQFYVHRFEQLCRTLEAAAEGRTVRVFHPSTAFIEERPKGMTEYAMAKVAAEVLIADLSRTLRHVRPVSRRLPRLATDQTAGLLAGGAASNVEVMLPVLRQVLAPG